MSKEKEEQPKAPKKAATQAPSQREPNYDWAVLLGVFVVLGFTAFTSWQKLNPEQDSATVAVATPTPTAAAPDLTLHQSHVRQVPQVTVNPNDIGKENPFQ